MKMTTYQRYLLVVLMVVLACNSLDRLALGLVMQDLKLDLHLTDTQLGWLTGLPFALFYSIMGMPIARWADRGNRITIIGLSTLLWSVLVALSGMATSFIQLVLIRVGVAVGEAGCVPPAHSLLADYFNRAERPRAVSIYMLGLPLSIGIGYFAAGWLNQLYGWRIMFMAMGLPGVVVALLAWLTLKEPRKAAAAAAAAAGTKPRSEPQPSIGEVCRTLWRIRAFRHLLAAFCVIIFLSYGIGAWLAAFFIRSHGLKTGELGGWFSLLFGVSSLVGIYGGGALASRFAPNNERLQLQVLAGLLVVLAVIRPFTYLVPDYHWAFVLIVPVTVLISLGDGPLFATIQSLVPQRMRATAIAIVYLFSNLIGMGLGPLAAGALSDAMRPTFGEDSLRWTLVALCPGYLLAVWHIWCASQTVTQDLDDSRRLEEQGEGAAA